MKVFQREGILSEFYKIKIKTAEYNKTSLTIRKKSKTIKDIGLDNRQKATSQ